MAKLPPKKQKPKQQLSSGVWDQITRIPLVYLVFFVLAFLIYGQVLKFYLGKFDEDLVILGNLKTLKDLSNLRLAFVRDAFLSDKGVSFYRPIQTVSYMFDAQFFQSRGSVFYFTNLLIHSATCSALFYLLSMFGNSRKTAFGFTLLYLASPLFVHAIAWAPSRGDLLIGLFGILSLVFFIKMVATRDYKFAIFAWLAFAVAMFSKETAVLLPFLIALYYFIFEKNKNSTYPAVLIAFGGFLLIILSYFFLRAQVVKLSSPAAEFGLVPLMHNLRTLPEYFTKFFIPVKLSPMSGFSVLNTVLGLVLFACLMVYALQFASKPYLKELFGLTWFLILAIPGVMYSHKFGSAAYDYLEHRSYLPMAGIIMMLFFIYLDIPEGKIKNRVSDYTILLAVVLGIYSFFYTRNYENPMVFYDHTISSNPASAMALSNRGLIRADLKDYQGAIEDYDKAVMLKKDYAQAYVNKGVSLAAMKDNAGAIAQYDSAIKYEPGLFQAHLNKANAKYATGLFTDAITEYTLSIKLYPTSALGYNARGMTYFQLGNYNAATKDFSTAIKIDSLNAVAYTNRGKSKFNDNDKKGACADWHTAVGLENSEARDLLDRYCK
jgi:Flp pilus assembly protein TadD